MAFGHREKADPDLYRESRDRRGRSFVEKKAGPLFTEKCISIQIWIVNNECAVLANFARTMPVFRLLSERFTQIEAGWTKPLSRRRLWDFK